MKIPRSPTSLNLQRQGQNTGRRVDENRPIMASGVAMLLPISRQDVNSTDLNSVNQKIDLLMTMMNDVAPVVKTLNKVYEDSLIAESDEDINDSDVGPPIKQTKLATDTTEVLIGVVDSLVSKVNTKEKTGPLMNQWPPKERRPLIGLKIVSYLQPPE